jgi:large subunit ribosomal protein L22
MEATARGRYLRIAPRKVRLVADEIRGKNVEAALQFLKYTNKKAARLMEKVLKAAIANAEQTEGMGNVEELHISRILVDGGPVLRRFMARALGRATRIRKRTSHVTLVVDDGV